MFLKVRRVHHDEAPWESSPLVLGRLTGMWRESGSLGMLAVVCSENVHLSKGRCLDRESTQHSERKDREGTLAHSPQVPESVGGRDSACRADTQALIFEQTTDQLARMALVPGVRCLQGSSL